MSQSPAPNPQGGINNGKPANGAAPGAAGTPNRPANGAQAGGASTPTNRPAQASGSDLNRIVMEYLHKKGYFQTESMLRFESSRAPAPAQPVGSQYTGGQNATNVAPGATPPPPAPPGAPQVAIGTNNAGQMQQVPIPKPPVAKSIHDDTTAIRKGYVMLRNWTEASLDFYQPELRRALYPIFVHCYLDIIAKGQASEARDFFATYSGDHAVLHGHDLQKLSGISLPDHIPSNELAQKFRSSKYRLNISRTVFDLLFYFLQEHDSTGGAIILRIVNQYIDAQVSSGRPNRFDSEGAVHSSEGLPDTAHGSQVDSFNQAEVKLGKLPYEASFEKEVEHSLREIDKGNTDGGNSLEAEFASMKSDQDSAPNREMLPLPPHTSVDIAAEIQAVMDSRAKIKVGPVQAAMPSVCMYTFHNTHDGLNCLDFSSDATLIAGGFSDSFVKVWSLNGSRLKSVVKGDTATTSKRLVGHAGPVYGVSFSPDQRYLLSASADKTVMLWSMDTYTALVCYKGHNEPVWDVAFSPHGHYFATASHDQTARLWSCDHIYPLRIFAGHMSDVDCVIFHPNGTYVFTGSSDRTVRMWDVAKGSSVRVFIGHTASINCLAVSPDGRWLASAGEDHVIILWEIGSGRRLKIMRGHGKASIYSLAFSREGTVLVSAGADQSIRVWDVKKSTVESGPEPENLTVERAPEAVSSAKGNEASKKREIVATPDHMAVYHTKSSPVYKVQFTSRNLCLAGGAFNG